MVSGESNDIFDQLLGILWEFLKILGKTAMETGKFMITFLGKIFKMW